MSNWKFTNATNQVVSRINEDGSCESCLVGVIADWLAEGNTPEPADPAPSMLAPVDPLAKLQAFLASNPDVAALL